LTFDRYHRRNTIIAWSFLAPMINARQSIFEGIGSLGSRLPRRVAAVRPEQSVPAVEPPPRPEERLDGRPPVIVLVERADDPPQAEDVARAYAQARIAGGEGMDSALADAVAEEDAATTAREAYRRRLAARFGFDRPAGRKLDVNT
jgi:hypothetical protein